LFAKRRKTKRESKKENAMRATEENSEAGLFLFKKNTSAQLFIKHTLNISGNVCHKNKCTVDAQEKFL